MTNLSRGRFRARRALIAAATPLALTLGPAVQAEETEQQLEGFSSTELGLTEESPAETDKPLISEDQLPSEGQTITIGKPLAHQPWKCDVFVDPRSRACLGPAEVRQPRNLFERIVQKGAGYAAQYGPSMVNGDGVDLGGVVQSEVTRTLISSGVNYANKQIKKIPFFAQTTLGLNAATSSDLTGYLDSFMRLKTLGYDNEGGPMGLMFGQARVTLETSAQPQVNVGLGSRYRLGDEAMVGVNGFWDLATTNYSTTAGQPVAYTRWGVGAEGFWKSFELRNNWYINGSGRKDVVINDIEYQEGVVPGWDVELGYRLPFYPQLAMYVRGFNWDYTGYHSDNSGLEGSVNWQATPHANLELWVSNEIPAYPVDSDNDIDNQPGPYFGVRVRLTGRAVNYAKNNAKQNLLAQMTQPVRRRYEVLLERVKKTSGNFSNSVGGS